MSKRSFSDIQDTDPPPEDDDDVDPPPPSPGVKRPKIDLLTQLSGIIQMTKTADAPFRMDDQGDIDCALDWCTYTHPDHKRTFIAKGQPLKIIEVYLTADVLVYPQSITVFNGSVIFEAGMMDRIKGNIPFLSPWVKYEFTVAEDKNPRTYPGSDSHNHYNIVKCRWKLPELNDELLVQLLSETGVAISQESVDAVRTTIVKNNGYNQDNDVYDPKVVQASLQDPKDAIKFQNSLYMILRYCPSAILLYGHANTARTSYSTLMAINKCLLSSNWYHLFFQWFKRMPETLLPQESRFLRELAIEDLPVVKKYFCIQSSPDNIMIEACIRMYNQMKIGPHKNRHTLCCLREVLRDARLVISERDFILFATKHKILRSETYSTSPDRWVLSFGDFEAERRVSAIMITMKKKEASGVPPTQMFDKEFIDSHDRLDAIQKGVLHDIASSRNPRRFLCLTGRAGSGKTTLIIALLGSAKRYSEKHAPPPPKPEYGKPQKAQTIPEPEIGIFTAYGFMAALIRNSTGHACTMTLSRAIAIMDMEENVPAKLELQKLKVVIIDEMSTVNMMALSNLLAGMPNLERLFFFGDPKQMSTIDRGSVCECFTRIFKSIDITTPNTIFSNPECTIFNMTRNYRQANQRILIDNFDKVLRSDPDLDFKVVETLKDLREATHPFIVIPITKGKTPSNLQMSMNMIAQEYLQSAEDSQRIMIMAQRNDDVTLLKDCLQNCDTYIKHLATVSTKQTTLEQHYSKHRQYQSPHQATAALQQKSTKARPLVVGELVRTTMNWYSRAIPGAPNVDYRPTGKSKTVPIVTSSISNNDIGILHDICDVNMANGCIVKRHLSTAAQPMRSTRDVTYARVMVLRPPTSKGPKTISTSAAAPTIKVAKQKKSDSTEYLFINNREYAFSNVVPRDVSTITVSQGQEAEVSCIYLPEHMFESRTFERSQFYTGITRATRRVILLTPVVDGRLPAVANILSNDTVPGRTNFAQKYNDLLLQMNQGGH
jgi:energy-coupling factor transporter ATP-binding protein EcfA2